MKSFLCASVVILAASLAPSAHAFSDVTTGDAHAEAINYLHDRGMVRGYSDGSFRPDALINRVEFLKIVYLATTGLNENEFEQARVCRHRLPYQDVALDSWYHVYLCTADSQGIIDGYPDGTFRPEQTINFAEASKIIAESFNREKKHLALTRTSATPWYKQYVVFLERENAIPRQIFEIDQPLTRGLMAEIMYRMESDYVSDVSRTYQELTGEYVQPEEYNRPEIYTFQLQTGAPSLALYFFPQTGEAAFVSEQGKTMMTFDAAYRSAVLAEHQEDIASKKVSLGTFILLDDVDGDGMDELFLQETANPRSYTVWKYETNEHTGEPWMFPVHYGYIR